MIQKCIVSSLSSNGRARVYLQDIGYVSNELPVASHITVQPNDLVVVAFFDNGMQDGIVIENLSRPGGQQPPGQGDKTYTYEQIIPAATWTIQHNLEKYPSVTVVDSADSVVMGDVQYTSLNEIKITFSVPFSGKAFLN